jgi:hypothetical protein
MQFRPEGFNIEGGVKLRKEAEKSRRAPNQVLPLWTFVSFVVLAFALVNHKAHERTQRK